MGKNHSWNGTELTQTLCGETFKVDIAALPADIINAAIRFALPTLLRNATAGLASEDPPKAIERVKARLAAWAEGKWSAKGEASAEPRTSLLARAVAEALGKTVAEAAAIIEGAVERALEAAELDQESEDDEEKAAVRKVGTDVRKVFREAAEVAPIYKRLKDEAAAKAASDKPKVSLASLIG
jgi:hypothetical protein